MWSLVISQSLILMGTKSERRDEYLLSRYYDRSIHRGGGTFPISTYFPIYNMKELACHKCETTTDFSEERI